MDRLILLPAVLLLGASHPALSQDDAAPSSSPAEGALRPVITIEPEYPVDARTRGVEGSVTVEFVVTASGGVEDVRVTESSPAGVFDQAALAAVRRWRYGADAERETTVLTERLRFALTDLVWELSDAPPAASASPTRSPQNDCVREGISFDYGEMVEVGLINTCSEPLLVFGCAPGTDRYSGQWVCTDSEQLGVVILRPGDGRIGSATMVDTTAGVRSFSYGENLYVARAPNTQYWWIACRQDDGACRDSARTWVRSVHRQLATVNPADRASVAVARSL